MRRRSLIAAIFCVLIAVVLVGVWLMQSNIRAVVTDVPPPPGPLQKSSSPSNAPADTANEPVAPEAVDLALVREALPNNRYWADQAPTTDPTVLERRAREKSARNVVWGRILSGSADTGEIDAYFAEREHRSRDAIAFARFVLDHYGAALSEQEQGLYTLAIDMNGTRIQAIPHDKAEALAKKQRQEEVRAAWQKP